MPDRPLLPSFLELSCRLTGFEAGTLQGTGLVEAYHDLLLQSLGEERFRWLVEGDAAAASRQVGPEAPAAPQGPGGDALARRLIRLWYSGHWDGAMVSPAAYRGGLLWRAIGVSPPGARPPGYGSWSLPPQHP